jgi:hypothetical protein
LSIFYYGTVGGLLRVQVPLIGMGPFVSERILNWPSLGQGNAITEGPGEARVWGEVLLVKALTAFTGHAKKQVSSLASPPTMTMTTPKRETK